MQSSPKISRPYAPDFVSAETLAHRLDCAVSTVHAYVQRGLLPKPIKLGNLTRWRWAEVEQHIDALEYGHPRPDDADPYFAGIIRATSKETGR